MSPIRVAVAVLALAAPAVPGQEGSIPLDPPFEPDAPDEEVWPDFDPRIPDPRIGPDPRDVVEDPRDVVDPRERAVADYESGLSETLEGEELFDALWEVGDQFDLARAMQEAPWELLPYMDAQCEQWLEVVETGGLESTQSRARARELEEKGRELARIADLSVGDTRFERYVDTVFGWRAEERQRFFEGRDHYDRGAAILEQAATPEDTLNALEPLNQALREARRLGVAREQSRALSLIGRVQVANGQNEEAALTMREAVDVGREIRDLDAVWTGLEVLYAMNIQTLDFESAEQILQEQYQLTLEVGDDERADNILWRMIDLDLLRDETVP